jgi:hypothetical protein
MGRFRAMLHETYVISRLRLRGTSQSKPTAPLAPVFRQR